jgi:hypothetical protein
MIEGSSHGPTNRVERVPLRTVWPHEQRDFSRWLVENIDLVNEHLPFDVDPDSLIPEGAAGDFWVDVVADATDPDSGEPIKVVIENQLEQTDHDHLGKVLTYLAAYDARAAIWISARARPEHAKAVQWLNDESSIDAWLFDVEVIRIAGSPVAPLLTQIIGPSALSRRAKADKQASGADQARKLEFWTAVLPRVADACRHLGLWQGRNPGGSVNYSQAVPNSVGRMHWQIWVYGTGSWICLRVDGASQQEATYYFEQLQRDRGVIDGAFGGELSWQALESARSSTISWINPIAGGFRDDPATWPAVGDAIADAMARLIAATQPHIAKLAAYQGSDTVERQGLIDDRDEAVSDGIV